MNKSQRASRILEELRGRGNVSAAWLSEALGVSPATVYRDLDELAARNLARKTHGGVELVPEKLTLGETVNARHMIRLAKNRLGKERIAGRALSLIDDDDVIFADSSTTVYYLVKRLLEECQRFSNLTIVTNSAALIREISDPPPTLTLIALGGVYNATLNSFLGRIAVEAVERLRITKAFVSAAAVSTSEIYTFHENHAEFLASVIKGADKAYLLADRLKFETRAIFPICETRAFTGIVSEPTLSKDVAAKYLAAGLNLIQ